METNANEGDTNFFLYGLMILPAMPIGWVYFKLWNVLLKWWYREPEDLMQQHPQRKQAQRCLNPNDKETP